RYWWRRKRSLCWSRYSLRRESFSGCYTPKTSSLLLHLVARRMQYPHVAGHFFPVGIQLLAGDMGADVGFVQRILHVLQALHDFPVALLHRQLEVDDSFTAPATGQPAGEHGAAAGGFVDDVADQPLHRLFRLEHVTVGFHMF